MEEFLINLFLFFEGVTLGEWTDQTSRMVYTNAAASIAVTYNSQTEQHR